jgi:hypothetical protein
MKIETWVWVALKAATAIAIVSAAAFWLRQTAIQTEHSNQQEIDQWVDENLADALSQKLNRSRSQLLTALHQPDHPINREIQQIVQSIDLRFSKESAAQVAMKLSILYRDGSRFSTTTDIAWDSLPSPIRKDFLKTGTQSVQIPWEFTTVKVS